MLINLSDPFWRTLIAGGILLAAAGTYHYIRTLITLYMVNKRFSNLLSEIDSLQRHQKKEITEINKKHKEEKIKAIEKALDIYDKKMDEILKHNKPPYSGSSNKLRDLYLSGRHAKSNKTS